MLNAALRNRTSSMRALVFISHVSRPLVLPPRTRPPAETLMRGESRLKAAMETLEAYLGRKQQELTLLNGFLGSPLSLRHPTSVVEVIEQKFQLAAALKAEHALHDWAFTETAWTHSGRPRSGPFEFKYDYQRADLDVRGPSFYPFEIGRGGNSVYAASGMAAISA